ncbi:lysophospholipid acyltransferase family protein [Herpetosiphon sp. NSE202]|uniref:lysophospholipid acyltransferase family protein n=1 Tax=Herpetosiphon sp. NSE202 TaxID=3351349 RepID=UPI00362B9533
MVPFVYHIVRFICRVLLGMRARLVVEGQEHLPTTGGYILASNHVSNWDPVALSLGSPGHLIGALGKQELFELPILGRIASAVGGIPVRRGEADREALARCKAVLQSGQPLIILPEGTRSRSGELLEGKHGIIAMAQLANVPIVPAAVIGTKTMGWPWRRSTVIVRYAAPIVVDRKIKGHEGRQIALDTTMHQIASMLPPTMRGFYKQALSV